MCELLQQAPGGERQVSALRQRRKRPETYLLALALVTVWACMDTYRAPANQVTVNLYVRGIHVYQFVGRPLLKGRIQCRYQPTCSDYSMRAVREFGLREGLLLTVRRIRSCTTTVPMGTADPLPQPPRSGAGNGS